MIATPEETVKLAISEAFRIFAVTGLPILPLLGAPQGADKLDPNIPIHAILFFPFFFS
jgi:hypothetical protein